MRQDGNADHFGGDDEHAGEAVPMRPAFADGVLEVRSRRLPWLQMLYVLPFIGVGTAATIVLSIWIISPRGRGAAAAANPAPNLTFGWVVCGHAIAWLVVHTVMVRRQRARAVEDALRLWKVRRNLKGLADFVSLALSQAGYKDGYFGVAWPRLGEVRDAVRGLAVKHRMREVPGVWVFDKAPSAGLRLLMKTKFAVLESVVSVGWFQFSPSVFPWVMAAAAWLMVPLVAMIGLLPGGVTKASWLIGAGVGAVVGFGVKLLYLRYCWRLVRVRKRTFLLRRRLRGGFRWRGPIEARDPLWILSPISDAPRELQPFVKSHSAYRADLFLHARDLPLVSTQIEEDEVTEYVPVDRQP